MSKQPSKKTRTSSSEPPAVEDRDNGVSSDDVKAFLAGNPGQPDTPDGGQPVYEVDIPSDVYEKAASYEPHAAPSEPRTQLPGDPLLDPGLPAGEDVWSRSFRGFPKVTVSELEQDLFFKAALNDDPVEFDVNIPSPSGRDSATIRCRTISNFEGEAIFRAAQIDQTEAMGLMTMEQINQRLQAYSVILRVTRFEGVAVGHMLNFPDPHKLDIDTAANIIRGFWQEHFKGGYPARFALMLTAVRLFEHKMTICKEGLANRNF